MPAGFNMLNTQKGHVHASFNPGTDSPAIDRRRAIISPHIVYEKIPYAQWTKDQTLRAVSRSVLFLLVAPAPSAA